MYPMKNIVSFADRMILPKCMYRLKNPIEVTEKDETEINISDQVTKFLKKMPNNQLFELEERQDKLLSKLDILYERIRTISSLCNLNNQESSKKKINDYVKPVEVVIVLSPDHLPWFLNIFLKDLKTLSVSWHIHSTVTKIKVPKIEAFFRQFKMLYQQQSNGNRNLRLIFKDDMKTPELKISSLSIPIQGSVNIIRYLCQMFPDVVPYDYSNHEVDALLDLCFQVESTEINRQHLLSKIFLQSQDWIYNNKFSIVDLAVFDIIKYIQNLNKYVSKKWLTNCETILM